MTNRSKAVLYLCLDALASIIAIAMFCRGRYPEAAFAWLLSELWGIRRSMYMLQGE